jgi:hypothetical protein
MYNCRFTLASLKNLGGLAENWMARSAGSRKPTSKKWRLRYPEKWILLFEKNTTLSTYTLAGYDLTTLKLLSPRWQLETIPQNQAAKKFPTPSPYE